MVPRLNMGLVVGVRFSSLPLRAATGSFTYCKAFHPQTPFGPQWNLLMDPAGNLYGTTYCDGANNLGNVWELSPSGGGWTYKSLHEFTGAGDGGYPDGGLVFDRNGNLYGTAYGGGASGHGVVWEITFP